MSCASLKMKPCKENPNCTWIVKQGCKANPDHATHPPHHSPVKPGSPVKPVSPFRSPFTGHPECIRSNDKKYVTRKSPPYPANKCCGLRIRGSDGKMYVSVPKNGICRWMIDKAVVSHEHQSPAKAWSPPRPPVAIPAIPVKISKPATPTKESKKGMSKATKDFCKCMYNAWADQEKKHPTGSHPSLHAQDDQHSMNKCAMLHNVKVSNTDDISNVCPETPEMLAALSKEGLKWIARMDGIDTKPSMTKDVLMQQILAHKAKSLARRT